jgi:hypothetical protein
MKPKIRYKMEVFSNGDAQEQIITLLSKHNAGECEFTLDELSTYLKLRGFLYSMVQNTSMEVLDNGNTANLYYFDKCFMKVTLEEVYELVES